jgi:hypothetical protein
VSDQRSPASRIIIRRYAVLRSPPSATDNISVPYQLDHYELTRNIIINLDNTDVHQSHALLSHSTSFDMAEAFGVAAGAFGVVSLSIQLAESAQKVKSFYDNVKNAPPKLTDLLDEIEEMSDLIKKLELQHQFTGVDGSPLMDRCIESSRKAVQSFATFSSELETRVQRRKLSGGIRFALSQEEIVRMLNRVERAKGALTLAYVQYQSALQQKQHESMIRSLQALALGQDAIVQLVNPAFAVQNTIAWDSYAISAHMRILAHDKQVFAARTPSWLSTTIWQLALDRAISGWQFSMRAYGVMPASASILLACRAGDAVEMQRLFDTCAASPFDQDEHGGGLWEVSHWNRIAGK